MQGYGAQSCRLVARISLSDFVTPGHSCDDNMSIVSVLLMCWNVVGQRGFVLEALTA